MSEWDLVLVDAGEGGFDGIGHAAHLETHGEVEDVQDPGALEGAVEDELGAVVGADGLQGVVDEPELSVANLLEAHVADDGFFHHRGGYAHGRVARRGLEVVDFDAEGVGAGLHDIDAEGGAGVVGTGHFLDEGAAVVAFDVIDGEDGFVVVVAACAEAEAEQGDAE